ncbi:hypothetical protein [Halostagnicola sp. A-GB9-2]|uniref:hypothetical protein n=1 Tax=Halostagnicola sp. A-GB9-2 TaxID=3048066 RepID=UPI0024BFA07B|nr:hypothetical protein [Halostagnicola sp. A-GB9-2]MDJ1434649.1 hypothetical protein [Halostagnicola sp. A-GB9-2]
MSADRRSFLAAVVVGSAVLAGCSSIVGCPSLDESPEAGVDELPDPNGHIYGAGGIWSSFDCNSANTREVSDGGAPVDGVSEWW